MRFRLYQGNVWAFSEAGAWVLQTHGAIEPQYWHWESLTQQGQEEMERIIDKYDLERAK